MQKDDQSVRTEEGEIISFIQSLQGAETKPAFKKALKALPPMDAQDAFFIGINLIIGIRNSDAKLGQIAESAAIEILTKSLAKG